MSFIYTRSQLKSRINAGIHGKIDMLISVEDFLNEVIRDVISEIDLRSGRRRADLQPKLFTDVYDYACPSDLQGYKIIDLPPQVKRADEFYLVPSEEFDIKKGRQDGLIAIDDYNGIRTLRIATQIDDKVKTISTMDSLTAGGGTWELFGDGTNLTKDADNYVKDSGSINWDISSAGGTTAGIQNTSLNSFDLDDDYLGGNGAAFVWVYINSITNLTNFILRLGSSQSVYHQKTITTAHDGNAFVAGWNLLRFDLTSLTDTGTPDDNAITYAAIYMTKNTTKVSETDYRFDNLVLRKGEIHRVLYYSKYGWQTSAGAYQENSSSDSDLLVADTDEYNLFIKKGIEKGLQETNQYVLADRAKEEYKEAKADYVKRNTSEVKIMTSEYYSY